MAIQPGAAGRTWVLDATLQVSAQLRIPVAQGMSIEEARESLLSNWDQHTSTLIGQLGETASLIGSNELHMIASGSLGLKDRVRDVAQRPDGFIAMPLRTSESAAQSAAQARALNLMMDSADPDNTMVGELADQFNRRLTDNRTNV